MSDLDKLYSPSEWNAQGMNPDEVVDKFQEVCKKSYEDAKKKIIALHDVDYGSQKLDVWGPNATTATHIFVYFHGGYWQFGSKADAGPLIDLTVNGAGIPLVSVGYDMATNRPLKEIITQSKEALEFIQERYKNAIFTVGGHSAGAFLAAAAVSALEDSRRIKQVLLIAGIYTLDEFAQTKDGRKIHLRESDSELNIDPGKLASNLHRRRITIFVAENDSPKFHEQADNLQMSIIEAAGNAVECEKLLIRTDDHFTIIENMLDRTCDPARHLLRRLRFF
ncbi:hypothetical protein FO519_009145 [Halicephalobus sp. NKZ332]|nr:hypothetical protein FO519_009145 [Halicephalobus sp. NKZ332]